MTVNALPPLEVLRQRVRYDEVTGDLIWLPKPRSMFSEDRTWRGWNTRFAGNHAGCYRRKDGITIQFDGVNYRAHRVVYYLVHGRPPAGEIDHIDGNPLNNRIENLRDVSRFENMRNRARNVDSTSPAPGVFRLKNKWLASMKVDGKSVNLGEYTSLDEAVAARCGAERALGFHPNHGRPPLRKA